MASKYETPLFDLFRVSLFCGDFGSLRQLYKVVSKLQSGYLTSPEPPIVPLILSTGGLPFP